MKKSLINFKLIGHKKKTDTTHINNVLAIEKKKYGCKIICVTDTGYRTIKASDDYEDFKEIFETNGLPFYESKAKSLNVVSRKVTMIGEDLR